MYMCVWKEGCLHSDVSMKSSRRVCKIKSIGFNMVTYKTPMVPRKNNQEKCHHSQKIK